MRCRFTSPLMLALMLVLTGCFSAARSHTYPRPFRDPLPGDSDAALSKNQLKNGGAMSGVWQGISSADCIGATVMNPGRCGSTQRITLTMLQEGDAISGYYTCAYGTQVCRNLDESGRIRDGVMIGRRMSIRIMLEDGSMCFFTGIPQNDVMEGRYSCLQGAGLIERGAFRTVRAY